MSDTKFSFATQVEWIDKFYNAYVRLGDKTGRITPEMKEDAEAAHSAIRNNIFQNSLSEMERGTR
ncbi:MAG: hypothetical protein WC455_27240 [Dehalococcoidia bacterium]|jgi:hypothetical protein